MMWYRPLPHRIFCPDGLKRFRCNPGSTAHASHLIRACRLVSIDRPMPSSTTRSAPSAAAASSLLICGSESDMENGGE